MFVMIKKIFRQKITMFENYNLTYNGLSHVYCIKPEGLVYKGFIAITEKPPPNTKDSPLSRKPLVEPWLAQPKEPTN